MNAIKNNQVPISISTLGMNQSKATTYLMVPMLIFFGLLIFAAIRGPNLISSTGIGSAVIVVAPLVLATYALTIIVMAGRASVDLSIGPLIGFINVSMIQLFGIGFMESPIAFFLFAMGVGIAYQLLQGLVIIFVRVQPIIVSLSGYLTLVGLNLIIMPRPSGVAPDWMFPWGSGTTLFSAILVILVLATVAWYLIARTAFFGHLRLMGADERAAYTSGVHINWVRLGAHAIGGIYAGLAAIAFTSLISSGDPTQGTTYTLMAVTALVLGGANLAGGRGSAFGSLLGALNIYLITYVLSTFNFGMVQSFITDLAYGVMLVLSLLISVAVPHIQNRIPKFSPLMLFVILAVISLGVIMHTSMDQVLEPLAGISSSSIVILSDGGIAQVSGEIGGESYSPGTYILFIVISITATVYVFRMLFKYTNVPMASFIVVAVIIALGLIFNPNPSADSKDTATQQTPINNIDTHNPDFFTMQTIDGTPKIQKSLEKSAVAVVTISGVVLLASLIILIILPQISIQTKRIAIFLFAVAVAVIAIGALFFNDFNQGYLTSTFSHEIYAMVLVGTGLFTLTVPLVHNRLKNITNIFIFSLGILTLICVYFFTQPTQHTSEGYITQQTVKYAQPIFSIKKKPSLNLKSTTLSRGELILTLQVYLPFLKLHIVPSLSYYCIAFYISPWEKPPLEVFGDTGIFQSFPR